MKVSPDGDNAFQCLNYSTNASCRTISYAITHGFSSVCLSGTFYNTKERIEVPPLVHQHNAISIFCNNCLLKDYEIILGCQEDMICNVNLLNCIIEESKIRISNIYVTFRNVSMDDSIISDFSNSSDNGTNEVHIENSSISCLKSINGCGLHLANISSTKLVVTTSNLDNFKLKISVSQLILIFHKTYIIMPTISVNVKSPEHLRIPAIIHLDKVTFLKNGYLLGSTEMTPVEQTIENTKSLNMLKNFVLLDLTNPYIIIKESNFTGVHLEIQSKRLEFEPVFLSILLDRISFVNGIHLGNGGGLAIISQVQNSEVIISDCLFSNNSATKNRGLSNGQGGGLYLEANSLRLIMKGCNFLGNSASDSGLALYTTEGVDVSLINCTFQYSVQPQAPIQQSLISVAGMVMEIQGLIQADIPEPESYVGPIDIFDISEGINLNVKIVCPKWYNHDLEYRPLTELSQALTDLQYKCNPCSMNYYALDVENKTLLHHNRKEKSLTKNNVNMSERCFECPYGALCTGNIVIPRPNYWGYWHKGKLVFQQCPADYCCSGSKESICYIHNYCPGNRMSTLCGACKKGFTVSILTGKCIPDSQCGGEQWFWILVIFAAVAYALWYTLKDDIFIFSIYGGPFVKLII